MNGELLLGEFAESLRAPRGRDGACATNSHHASVDDARSVVYRVLSRSDRREEGVFFSGDDWAEQMVRLIDVSRWRRFVDPSAGIGDLLLALGQRLPLAENISLTLKNWSILLGAVDLRASFLEIAWSRIRELALTRHAARGEISDQSAIADGDFCILPKSFIVSDFLAMDLKFASGDCLVMNPPYQRVQAPRGSAVGTGLRSAAALHIENVLKHAEGEVGIVALVPDVLRSGSSYRRFREYLTRNLDIKMFGAVGHFGESADIDVAILVGITQSKAREENSPAISHNGNEAMPKIADVADVRVGAVVPHRTPNSGNEYGYLTAKNTPLNSEIKVHECTAHYKARLEKAPFVVVRRTSSPSDRQRARCTIIAGDDHWLVENHLIVIKPKIDALSECRAILRSLTDERTNEWLNDFIRCRHLTVAAILNVPHWRGNDE